MATGRDAFGDFERVDAIFKRALALAPEKRERFLRRACGPDRALLAHVRSLLMPDAADDVLTPGGAMRGPMWQAIARGAEVETVVVGTCFGPWRVLEEIGRGGMAVVYRGERADGAFEQQVAIKLLHAPQVAGEMERRFARERRILAKLQHPSIARLLDGGADASGRSFLVMEYIEGEPIDDYCDRRQLSIGARLELFLKVCAAVQFAHRNLIVHRDIKPSNILINHEGEPKLLDFGIAKLLEPDPETGDLTQTALVDRVLTPQYASPEQILGEPVSTATDVYALGMLLYEMLTGRRARRFDTSNSREIERVICDTDPVAPSLAASEPRLGRRLKGDLDNIVLTALRREPERRYTSAERLASDLRNHLEGRPVAARPDSVAYRSRKFVSRHRLGVATSVGVVLLITALIGFYTERLARERDIARQAASRAQVEAEKAEQVAEFLMELFEASRPEQARGEEITARELLALGVERADALRDQPEVRARLLAVTGKTYHRLGRYDEAETLYRQALALREQHFGLAHAHVAGTLNDLGVLYKDRGDYESARTYLDRAVALRRQVLGGEHEDLAVSLDELGRLYQELGDYTAATPPSTRSGSGRLYKELGDYTVAERYFREGLAMRRRLLGNEHHETASSINSVAHILRLQGDLEGAEMHFREALSIYIAWFGEEHPWVGIVKSNLALVLTGRGQLDEAETLLLESLDIQRRMLDPDHPNLAFTVHDLANVYFEQGRYQKAESLFTEAIGIARAGLGEAHPRLATFLLDYGRMLLEQGDAVSAEPLFREALEIRGSSFPADDWRTAEARGWLGAAVAALGRFGEAEPLALQSYSVLEAQWGSGDRRTREAAQRVMRLYEASGRPEKAAAYRFETDAE